MRKGGLEFCRRTLLPGIGSEIKCRTLVRQRLHVFAASWCQNWCQAECSGRAVRGGLSRRAVGRRTHRRRRARGFKGTPGSVSVNEPRRGFHRNFVRSPSKHPEPGHGASQTLRSIQYAIAAPAVTPRRYRHGRMCESTPVTGGHRYGFRCSSGGRRNARKWPNRWANSMNMRSPTASSLPPYDRPVSLVDLSHRQRRRPVECVIRHVDGTLDRISLQHSYTSAQLEWFRRGSALTVLVSETEAGPP